jgi:hypothetical protein
LHEAIREAVGEYAETKDYAEVRKIHGQILLAYSTRTQTKGLPFISFGAVVFAVPKL